MAKVKIDLEDFKKKSREAIKVIGEIIEQSEKAQDIVDAFFDHVEDYIKNTKTKVDDSIGLPACALIRGVLGVPDND